MCPAFLLPPVVHICACHSLRISQTSPNPGLFLRDGTMKRLGLIALSALMLALGSPQQIHAADNTQKAAAPKSAKLPGKPFRGKLKTIDAQTRTIVLTGAKAQTFQVTAETKIFKDDRPATFADLAVGQPVTGYARQTAESKWEARSIYQGQHTPK